MIMKIEYDTVGTCSRHISIEVDPKGIIADVKFLGGCHGNTQGVAALVRGMKVAEVVERCKGITCGSKGTSCPDQLARALEDCLC